MVCKKEVIAWFCDLTLYRRIDFLCALMDCCSPLELRFLGTYVESLGRRDYDRLRESELHANDVSYLSKLTNITDIRILDKVLTSLALMNSRCMDGATVLYRTLKEHTDAILSNGFRTRHSHTETDEKVVLLAVMALNHPAFTFSQKQALRSQLYALLQAVEGKVNLLTEMEDADDSQSVTADDVTSKESKEQLASASTSCPDGGEMDKSTHTQEPPPVHIKAIEVKGLKNRQSDKRLEYTFQVQWSDSSTSCVNKTYAQLFEFQCKLVQLFPDEANTEQHQDRLIPYIPGKRIFSTTPPGEQGEKTQAEIVEYAKQLSSLPQHILQCDHVINFFSPISSEGSPPSINSGHHNSMSPSPIPSEKAKSLTPGSQQLPPQPLTNQTEPNKQLPQLPTPIPQLPQPLQPHNIQQAMQQQQPSIHLRHPQAQQFQTIHMQQQQQQQQGQQHQPPKGHISPNLPLSPQLHQIQMAHMQMQQQQQQQVAHHHHHLPHHHLPPPQLMSPGNPALQQQQPQQQQMHQLPTTPTHNLTASVNQLHITQQAHAQHHHQAALQSQVQPQNGNGTNGENSSGSNGGSVGVGNGGSVSMPSSNNSIVTSTYTTTSAASNSVYYQTVSSMAFIPNPQELYTNAGGSGETVPASQQQQQQQSYKSTVNKVQPKPPQHWPQSFAPPPSQTTTLYATAPSTTQVCISPLQSPMQFRYPVPFSAPHQGGMAPHRGDTVAPLIHEWLKKQRLHKYAYLFEGMTFEQVLKLTDEEIDRWSIVKGAKGRIKTQLEHLRRNDWRGVNGLSPQSLGLHPNMPISPGFFVTQQPLPGSPGGGLVPQLGPAHTVFMQHLPGEGTNSECSTPPSSPRESSDENDRDSEESESSATSCPEVILNQAKRKENHTPLQPQQMSPRDQQASVSPRDQQASLSPRDQQVSLSPRDQQGSVTPRDQQASVSPREQGSISPREQQATMSPRDQQPSSAKSSPRNPPSATSLPYSLVVKAVGVDAQRHPTGEPRQLVSGNPQQQQQQQQIQLKPGSGDLLQASPQQQQLPPMQLSPQQPHMQQNQQRANAMPPQPQPLQAQPSNAMATQMQPNSGMQAQLLQPMPPQQLQANNLMPAQPQLPLSNALPAQSMPPSNAVVIGKQLQPLVGSEGSAHHVHQLDSPVMANPPFPPQVLHLKQANGKQNIHTVQYIQGDGEGGVGYRNSKLVMQPGVVRGTVASPSPPAIPVGTLQTRNDPQPIPAVSQVAPAQDPASSSAKTIHPIPLGQHVLNPMHSLPFPTTDGYIAPTTVTYVIPKHNMSVGDASITAESLAFNNNQPSYNSCTSCGCNGQCGQTNHLTTTSAPNNNNVSSNTGSSGSNVGTTSSPPMQFNHPTYIASPGPINFPNFYHHQGNMLPPAPGTPNSVLPHPPPPNLPPSNSPRFQPPMHPSLHGALPEMLYGANPQFGMLPPGAQMYLGGLGMGHRGHAPHPGNGNGGSGNDRGGGGPKKGHMMCFNCGIHGHRASECREPTMESITHNSHYRLNYKSSQSSSETTEGSTDS